MANFLTASEVIEFAFKSDIDPSFIKDHEIRIVEERDIKYALGKKMYNDLKSKYPDNMTEPLTYIYDNYIKYAISYYVKSRMLSDVVAQSGDGGIFRNEGFNGSQPISSRMLGQMQMEALTQAQKFIDEMQDYIKDNEDDFSKYKGKKTKFIGGIIT